MHEERRWVADTGIRITTSQLWETLSSLSILVRHPDRAPWPYSHWAVLARRVLAGCTDVAPVRRLYEHRARFSPDLVWPIPPYRNVDIQHELSAVRANPSAMLTAWLVRMQTRGRPPRPAGARARNGNAVAAEAVVPSFAEQQLAELTDGLAAYWREAVAPYWDRMRSFLDEEVLNSAATLATEGPDALFTSLCESETSAAREAIERTRVSGGRMIYLLPLLFAQPRPSSTTDCAGDLVISYQARGVAELVDRASMGVLGHSGADEINRLGRLVGRSRSTILRALESPATTLGLALQLQLAPSTVSEHLTNLILAGVVHRRRAGRQVLYQLNPAGATLLRLLEPALSGFGGLTRPGRAA